MKRLLGLMVLGLALCALAGFVGCSDDDDNDLVGPTAADSAEVELFMSQFDEIDEANGQMFNGMIRFIDSIMAAGEVGKVSGTAEAHVTLEWHAASQFWYCTAVDTSDFGEEVFTYVDSVQFFHGDDTVQWPVDTLLTEVHSFMRLYVTGDYIDTATATQNLVLTAQTPGSDTVFVTGTGGLLAEVNEIDVASTDTTFCNLYVDLGYVYTGLRFDMSSGSGDDVGCPGAGTMAATGSVDVTCIGAFEASVSGDWTVTEEFDNGEITIVIQHGGFTYRTTQYCY